jgi:dihydroorotate dehydrogenase electron transfer subunit
MSGNCVQCSVRELRPRHEEDGQVKVFELLLDGFDQAFTPGQFVMIRPAAFGLEHLWGRAFSIVSVEDGVLRLFIQVAGKGTAKLSRLKPGDEVAVWGPLGNGFLPTKSEDSGPVLILAGGVGLASFSAYAKTHPRPDDVTLLFGHRLPKATYSMDDFAHLGSVQAMHEQRPEDLQAFIDAMGQLMREVAHSGIILACGPTPFLRTVRKLALSLKARAYLSLENTMGCGVGACMGCVVQHVSLGPVPACTRGPVFKAEDIDLGGGQ